jgi:Tol biopolymer transport system component
MIANTDGSDLHSLPISQGDDFWPVFSPDNKTIIFARSGYYGSYSPITQPHQHAWSFHLANVDGTNVRQLTHENFYMASLPSISPDGKSMLLVTEKLDSPPQIAIYALENAEKPVQSFRPHVPGQPPSPIFDCPNYMPDGKSILFIAASDSGVLVSRFNYDVYRLDLATGALERLTKGKRITGSLKVFPDGKTAVFIGWYENWRGKPVRSELYLLDLQTHKLTPLKVNGLN